MTAQGDEKMGKISETFAAGVRHLRILYQEPTSIRAVMGVR